jgi:Membrane magnesium transporter
MSLSSILFVLGTILLLHSAYSCLHYRSLVQELEEVASGISSDAFLDSPIVASTTGSSSSGSTNANNVVIVGNSSSTINVPPIDVWIEVIIGFIIILISELVRSGSTLQPVGILSASTSTGTSNSGSNMSEKPKHQQQHQQRQSIAPLYISRDFDIYYARQRGFY